MTLLFVDSFDHYATTELTAKEKWDYYDTYSENMEVAAVGRRGTNGVKVDGGNGTHDSVQIGVVIGDTQTLIMGAAFYFKKYIISTGTAHNNGFACFDSTGGGYQASMVVEANGSVTIRRGSRTGTILAQSAAGVCKRYSWNYIEFKITIDNAAGAGEVYVNGESVVSVAGVDTQSTANAFANRIYLGLKCGDYSGNGVYADDFYLCDDAGAVANDFLGDLRIDSLFADGAGNSTDWTPSAGNNYECVDEVTPNDDTDYVSENSVADHDTYTYENTPVTAGSIFGIQHLLWARKDDAPARSIVGMIRSGGTDYAPGATHALTTSYIYYRDNYEVDPDTAAAWIIAGVNGAEFGERLEA